MIVDRETLRLRSQRNIAAAVAVLLAASGIGVCLPANLERRATLKSANSEVISLQKELVELQRQITDSQAAILQVQGEITRLSK